MAAFSEKTFHEIDNSQKFQRNWHLEVMADYLERCERGEIKRLIINLPPRSLKSLCISIAFPAWLLGRDPSRRIINVSYSSDLSNKWARDARAIMSTDWYQETFPHTRISQKKRSENEFETTKNGYRLSTSIGGVLTGRGGSFIIIDDPLKPQEALSQSRRSHVNEWFANTLYSRLDNKNTGCIVIVMQRLHIEDLVDFVQRHEKWEVLNLPAIAEKDEEFILSNGKKFKRQAGDELNGALESKAILDSIKANIGSYNFSAQYQQQPLPESGNILKWPWFKVYDDIPRHKERNFVIQSWDTAMTEYDGSDYSVCITMREVDRTYYILDVFRERLDFPALVKKVKEKKSQFHPNKIIVEDKGSGTGLIQQLKYDGVYAIPYKPEGSKADRMAVQSSIIEAGRVFIPRHAPWLEDFKTEVIQFPHGRYDDQMDALSQALDNLNRKISILDVLG